MRATDHTIVLSDRDLERLLPMLDSHDTPAAELLDGEIRRATVVPHDSIDPDIVTMNSDVVYEDCESGVRRSVRVVYPQDADASRGQISVLAPIGSALLGLRVAQRIEWTFPRGRREIVVVEVSAQPDTHT